MWNLRTGMRLFLKISLRIWNRTKKRKSQEKCLERYLSGDFYFNSFFQVPTGYHDKQGMRHVYFQSLNLKVSF